MVLLLCCMNLWCFKDINMSIIELQVPHVNRTDYQLIDISEDGFVWSSFPFDYFLGFKWT